MLRRATAALAGALLLTAGAASAQTQAPRAAADREVSIPFITYGTVRNFESGPRGDSIYIQNSRRDWYRATFFSRCLDLPFATAIGFKTFGRGSTLQKGDTIIAGRERCRIASIVRSGPPPKKVKKAKHA